MSRRPSSFLPSLRSSFFSSKSSLSLSSSLSFSPFSRTFSVASPSSSSSSSSYYPKAPANSSPSAEERVQAARANLSSSSSPIQLKGIRHDGSSRRFYKAVEVSYLELEGAGGRQKGWAVTLNGRSIQTTLGNFLLVPTERLARILSLEWHMQRDKIVPSTMPLTTIAVNAIDLARSDKENYVRHFQGAIAADSICCLADSPPGLVKQQEKVWLPLVSWANDAFGLSLTCTEDFALPATPEETKRRLNALLLQQDEWTLAVLDNITVVSKSLIVALALLAGRITIPQACEAARLHENYQIKQYGKVEGVYGHAVDIEFTRMELAASKVFADSLLEEKEGLREYEHDSIEAAKRL